MSRSVLVSLAIVVLVLSPSTARAAWGPDSVVFLGGPRYPYGIGWGAVLPAGGGGMYAVWHAPVQSGLSRVTSEGGRVFSAGSALPRKQPSRIERGSRKCTLAALAAHDI